MNLGQLKTKVTQIIREYSNNGSLIGSGDNADYLLSMKSFINDAQFELNSKRPIVKKITLSEPTLITDNFKRYEMPGDFAGFKELKLDDYEFTSYDWEDKILVIPSCYNGIFNLWYYAYPTVINTDTADDTELEIDLDLQQIIAYYVAGHVIIDENPSLAQYFLDEYSTKLRKVKSKNTQKRIKYNCGW